MRLLIIMSALLCGCVNSQIERQALDTRISQLQQQVDALRLDAQAAKGEADRANQRLDLDRRTWRICL